MKSMLVSIVVLSAFLSAVAHAQDARPARPYRGLFAGGLDDSEQSLTLNASAGSGWYQSVVADEKGRSLLVGGGPGDFQGAASTASAVLSYSLNASRASVGASAGTTALYHRRVTDRVLRREYATVGTSAAIGAGFTVQAAASYQPYSLRSLFPTLMGPRLGDPAIADEDFPASAAQYLAYSAGTEFSRRLTRRQTFVAGYEYGRREASGEIGRHQRQSAHAGVTRELSRDLKLHVGYGYTAASYDGRTDPVVNHRLDLGVNYSRALSFSRRTTLTFGSGTSAAGASRGASLRYRATGNARLNHEIGRSWNATISYNRGLQFVDAWPEPVFSDSGAARLGGLITRRLDVELTARALRGGRNAGRYGEVESYHGVAAVRAALTRHVGAALTYSYYRHRFGDALALAPGFPHDFDGQLIRASINVWAPLFQRARRP